jgi:hypothetical protein
MAAQPGDIMILNTLSLLRPAQFPSTEHSGFSAPDWLVLEQSGDDLGSNYKQSIIKAASIKFCFFVFYQQQLPLVSL